MSAPFVPYSTVWFCQDVTPDVACDGNFGPYWAGLAWLQPSAWVGYVMPGSGQNCFSGPGVFATPPSSFAPFNALPPGACVYLANSLGGTSYGDPLSQYGYTAPSSITMGGGGIYSPPFDISQLDSSLMGEYFSAGLLLVVTGMAIGTAIRVLLRLIQS